MNMKWIGFLRIAVGIFFLSQGINKFGWFSSSEFLKTGLDHYSLNPHPVTAWYQEHVAKPGVEVWARLIPAGEMAIGIALIFGIIVQTTLVISLLLVINFHLANGTIFSWTFFSNPYALLLLSSILVLLAVRSGNVFALRLSKGKKVSRK